MQAPRSPRAARAFTLIELLTVIAIIVILAALTIQTAGFMQEKAANSRAQAEIASLENAIEAYKLDYGTYPEQMTPNASSTNVLVEALFNDQVDATPPRKPYFEIPPRMFSAYRPNQATDVETLRKSGGVTLVDPFGNPYRYQSPGDEDRNGEQFFDLFSKGKRNQGADASNDPSVTALWIKNW